MVFFAVRFVVFVIVRNEIVKGESIVGGYEVHARPGLAPSPVKQVAGAGNARGEIGKFAFVALPV